MGPSKRLKALQQEKSDLVARMESLLNSADYSRGWTRAPTQLLASSDFCETGTAGFGIQ